MIHFLLNVGDVTGDILVVLLKLCLLVILGYIAMVYVIDREEDKHISSNTATVIAYLLFFVVIFLILVILFGV